MNISITSPTPLRSNLCSLFLSCHFSFMPVYALYLMPPNERYSLFHAFKKYFQENSNFSVKCVTVHINLPLNKSIKFTAEE